MENGLVETFWENGNIEYRVNYKDDKLDGLCKWFYSNGNIWYKKNYKDGKRDGLYEYFNKDGSLNYWKYFKDDIEVTDNYIRLETGEVFLKSRV
jgi:hypothetical protein